MTAGDLIIEISEYVKAEDNAADMASLEDFVDGLSSQAASGGLDDLFSAETADSNPLSDLFADAAPEAANADIAAERPVRKSEVTTWEYQIATDSSGLATIEPKGDETVITLDTRPVRASVYMMSPATNRPVGLSFIGFVGKAGDEQTLTRIAGKILASALHLPVFQTVAGMSGIALEEDANSGVSLEASLGKAQFNFKVYAFESAGGSPSASGTVVATANPEYADVNLDTFTSTGSRRCPWRRLHRKFGVHAGAVASLVGR